MQTLLKHWADALLEWLGLASAQDSGWDRWVAFTLVLLAVALFDFVCRTILVRGMSAPSCWGSSCRWFSKSSPKPGRS